MFRIVTFSTYLLGAWLWEKAFAALSGSDEALSLRFLSLVDMYFAVARGGASRCDEPTIMSARGVELIVDHCLHVQSDAIRSIEGGALAGDWDEVRRSALPRRMAPLVDGGSVSLGDVAWYLCVKVYYSSSRLEHWHWLVLFRNAALRVAAAFVELAVAENLQRGSAPKLRETDLWASSGKRRQRMSTLKKTTLLRLKLEKYGCTETLLNGAEEVHGLAARIRLVSNALYYEESQRLFERSTCLACNWDSSCHGGLNVCMGLLYDPCAAIACYMVPQVGGPQSYNVCVLCLPRVRYASLVMSQLGLIPICSETEKVTSQTARKIVCDVLEK